MTAITVDAPNGGRGSEITNTLQTLVDISTVGAKKATEEAAANYRASRAITFAILGFGVLSAAGAMAFSNFGIARPIDRIRCPR